MARPRVLFVDREGALAVWSLMIPVAEALEQQGWSAGFALMTDASGRRFPPAQASLGVGRIDVPTKRWPGDLLRQQRAFESGFAGVVQRLRPDVVHVNFAIPGIWARRVAGRMGVAHVVSTQHELAGSLAPHLRLGLWATGRRVHTHTYVSRTVARSFGRPDCPETIADGPPPAHVVIRNAVDEAALTAVERDENAIVRGRIVAPGRLVPEKGHALLVRTLAVVRAIMPGAHLVIAGSGPEEKRLRSLTRTCGVEDAVEFRGWLPRDELWRLLASAEAAAFASDGRQEGFGLALAEAGVIGVPLIASRIGAFREVLADDDAAAHWFPPKDLSGLLQAMQAALRGGRTEMPAIARAHVHRRASLSGMVDRYAGLYAAIARHRLPETAACA